MTALQRETRYALTCVAQQLSLGRSVTVTWAKHDMPGVYQRAWRRRARSSVRLHHPGIARVIDMGTHEGRPFVVSEYLDGGHLGQRLEQRGKPSAGEFDRVANALMDALAYAHARGVTHRDLHIGRVRVTQDGPVERTAVSGWTEPVDVPLASDASPAEILARAPERLVDPEAGDQASDIYALGALLFHLATGEQAVRDEGDDLRDNMVAGHVRRLASTRYDLPTPISEAIVRAMAPDPRARPQSVAEFRELLVEPELPSDVTQPIRRVRIIPKDD